MTHLLPAATVIVGTEEEIAAAADRDDPGDAIAALLGSCSPQALVVKRGARGASVYAPGADRRDVPPFRVDVLNVLGAGDAFASGLIAGVRRGWPVDRAVRMGNAAGAIVVTRHGCANFMPTAAELDAFVQEHGGW
jgi:5-dehydro-2-deoxygluconokinase